MKYNFNWSAISSGAPYVTLSSTTIAFNSFSVEMLGSPQKVIVGFDEEQCLLGVKSFNGEENLKPYDFANRLRNGWVRIGCKEFMSYLQKLTGISFMEAKRYIATYDKQENVLIVSILGDSERE